MVNDPLIRVAATNFAEIALELRRAIDDVDLRASRRTAEAA
jgi:hypothetical protein